MRIMVALLLVIAAAMAANVTNYAITAADYAVDTTGKEPTVDVTYTVYLYNADWTEVPLLGGDFVVLDSSKPLSFKHDPQLGDVFYYVSNSAGTQKVTMKIQAETAKGFKQDSITLTIPSAMKGALTVKIAGGKTARADNVLNEKTEAGVYSAQIKPGTNRLVAYWGDVVIPEEQKTPIVYADSTQTILVKDTTVATDYVTNYNIQQAGINQMGVQIPASERVISVESYRMKEWKETALGNTKQIDVFFESEVEGAQTLTIKTEADTTGKVYTANAPELLVLNVARQNGFLAIAAEANAEVTVAEATGLTRVDPTEFPAWTPKPALISYKWLNERYSLTYSVQKYEEIPVLTAVIDKAAFTTLVTNEGRAITKAVYDVKNNKKQFLKLTLPENVEVWSAFVNGEAVKPSLVGSELYVPLTKSEVSGGELYAFPVEVVFIHGEAPFGITGMQSLDLPSADLAVSAMSLSVYAPNSADFVWWGGNMEQGALEGSYGGGYYETPSYDYGVAMAPSAAPKSMNFEEAMAPQEIDVRDFAGAVENVVEKGVLPVKVTVPHEGKLYSFKKVLLVPGDKASVGGWYVDQNVYALVIWLAFFAVLGLLYKGFFGKAVNWKKVIAAIVLTFVVGYMLPATLLGSLSALAIGLTVGVGRWAYNKATAKKR